MKWAGAILLVASSYICGFFIAAEENKKLKALDSLCALLEYIKRRMVAQKMPLYVMFSNFSDEYLEETGFLPLIRSARCGTDRLWAEGLEKLPLSKEIYSELKHFGEELGLLPLDAQTVRLDVCLQALEQARSEMRQGLQAKKKSIKTVALLFGLLTAIILL